MLKRKIEDTLLQWKNTRADILQGNLGEFKGAAHPSNLYAVSFGYGTGRTCIRVH